jgi:transcription antitermination factor NusG
MSVEEIHGRPHYPWFAIRVRSRWEKSVAMTALNRGYEGFLPLYRRCSRWSDRFQSIDYPLLPGYVFCRVDPVERFNLLTIPGVMFIVNPGKPVRIDEGEIARLKSVSDRRLGPEPCPFLEDGERVRLGSGPLAGIEGQLVEGLKGPQLVLSIGALQRSVAVPIEAGWVAEETQPCRRS